MSRGTAGASRTDAGCVVRAYDGDDLLGFVAVDTTVGGCATGGLRMAGGVSEREVRDLARTMTLKFGVVGLPQGGAKGCVLADPEGPPRERRARLDAFGRAIAPMLSSRLYLPDVDMGTDEDDVARLLAAAGVAPERHRLRPPRSGADTARTVGAAVRAAMGHVGAEVGGCTVAIEGFGSVGGALAGRLAREGARVVAVSTSRGAVLDGEGLDVGRMRRSARELGSAFVEEVPGERIEPDALLELDVDVLCPCARWRAIHDGNAGRVRARLVSSGANAPVTREAARVLAESGTLVVPDFVANCGGVLGGTMAFAGVTEEAIRRTLSERWEAWVRSLLAESDRRGVSPRTVAEPLALERHESARIAAERPGLTGRLFGFGIELHRRGWIPQGLTGRLAEGWFAERTRPAW